MYQDAKKREENWNREGDGAKDKGAKRKLLIKNHSGRVYEKLPKERIEKEKGGEGGRERKEGRLKAYEIKRQWDGGEGKGGE